MHKLHLLHSSQVFVRRIKDLLYLPKTSGSSSALICSPNHNVNNRLHSSTMSSSDSEDESGAEWRSIPCKRAHLNLNVTLTGGQSFRWKPHPSIHGAFIGVMGNCLWILRQSGDKLQYRVLGELPYPKEPMVGPVRLKLPKPKLREPSDNRLYADIYYDNLLQKYFRLGENLDKLMLFWRKAHPHFNQQAKRFDAAIRQLDQDPVENLFSFICSQNNNISRIATMVEMLCTIYGPKICDYDGQTYHAFPSFETLAKPGVTNRLLGLKFGYRAKYIEKSAAMIALRGGINWFDRLYTSSYENAREELLLLAGIGPKVADCICLMSLNKLDAIPVDTHVFQIAVEHYMRGRLEPKAKASLKVYKTIAIRLREVYGPKAGWAQTVLFCADLAKFKTAPASDEEPTTPVDRHASNCRKRHYTE